jgi:hypothetical protein
MCGPCVIERAGLCRDFAIRSCTPRRARIEVPCDELRVLRRQCRALRKQPAQSARRPAELSRHHVEVLKGSVLQNMIEQTLHIAVGVAVVRTDPVGQRDGLVPYFRCRPREKRRHNDGAHAKSDFRGATLAFESKHANALRVDESGRARLPAELTHVAYSPAVAAVENEIDARIRRCGARRRVLVEGSRQRPRRPDERRVIGVCDCHGSTLCGAWLEVPGECRECPGSSPAAQTDKDGYAQCVRT